MTRIRMIVTAVGFSLIATAASAGPAKRCGWLVNPTPGNYWLNDAQGTWTLRYQGQMEGPQGMDLVGDLSAGDYVRTNGYYGYACACMSVDTRTDNGDQRITKIYSFQQLPIKTCRADKALERPR